MDDLLEQLRYKGEGSDLDYKAERYPFSGATDEQKSELLKDILALANAHRDGPAYILIGFKEAPPNPAEVVGLPADGAIDDARLQQFINEKLETKLIFKYEERLFDGKHVAVISIPKQQRPFYLKKDYGRLTKETVYVRRGSSTGIATIREITTMGAANVSRSAAKVELLFHSDDNQPLPSRFDREFLNFYDGIPDYEEERGDVFQVTRIVNRDYWREGARYLSCFQRAVKVRIELHNGSEFSLSDAQLEVTCRVPAGESVELLRASDMPGKPSQDGLQIHSLPAVMGRMNQRMRVDDRGVEPIANIELGTIRPGQSVRAEDDLAILPSSPGRYVIQVRVLANEIPSPLLMVHEFDVEGDVKNIGKNDYPQKRATRGRL